MKIQIWTSLFIITSTLLLTILHIGASDTFPILWDDELLYILQARAFSEHGTTFTTEILANRPLMTKPPGWIILLSAWAHIFPFDIFSFRACSFFFYVLSFFTLASIARQFPNSTLTIIGIFILFCSPQGIMTSNIARMDIFLLFLWVFSLKALLESRYYAALASAVCGLFFHFNAVWIIFASGSSCILARACIKKDLEKRGSFDTLLVFLSFIILSFLALWIWHSPNAFYADFLYDLKKKLGRLSLFFCLITSILFLLLLPLVKKFANSIDRKLLILGIYSVSFITAYIIGGEPWYEIYALLGIYFVGIFITQKWYLPGITPICISTLLFLSPFIHHHRAYGFLGMYYSFGDRYISQEEQKNIQQQLYNLSVTCAEQMPMSIMFPAQGTALYFLDTLQELGYQLKVKLHHQHIQSQHTDIYAYVINREKIPHWINVADKIKSNSLKNTLYLTSDKKCFFNNYKK